jgi:hypothetical protein
VHRTKNVNGLFVALQQLYLNGTLPFRSNEFLNPGVTPPL